MVGILSLPGGLPGFNALNAHWAGMVTFGYTKTMARHILRAIFASVTLLSAQPASAQSTVYVSGTGFADVKLFGGTSSVYYLGSNEPSLDATGAGGGLRIGTFLHPRLSVELSVDAGTTTRTDVQNPIAILAIYPPPRRRDLKASTRFLTVSTLVGYHPPTRGHVRFGYFAGFSFVRGTYRSDYPTILPLAATASTF